MCKKPPIVIWLLATVFFLCAPAWPAVVIHEKGTWPADWPKELEPYRFQAKTFGIAAGIQENVYEIPVSERGEFERIWPTILELKSRGAPLRLRSIERPAGDAKGPFAFTTDEPLIRICAPAYGSSTQKPGGPMLWVGPPWPESIKSPEGLLPEHAAVSEDGTTWVPATENGATGFKWRARIEVELLVDGNVIDLNRIRFPRETPIIDERQVPEGAPVSGAFTRLVSQCLREIQSIKPGATRADLRQVLRAEGGISNRQQRRYVYKDCPFIKVDVRFRAVDDGGQESDADIITSISPPFLQWSILD